MKAHATMKLPRIVSVGTKSTITSIDPIPFHPIHPWTKQSVSTNGWMLAALLVITARQARMTTDAWRARARMGRMRDPPPLSTFSRSRKNSTGAKGIEKKVEWNSEDRLTEKELALLAAREEAESRRREEQYRKAAMEEEEKLRVLKERERKEKDLLDPIVQEELRKREEAERRIREEAKEKARMLEQERLRMEEIRKEEMRKKREDARKKMEEDRKVARERAEAERKRLKEEERKNRITAEKEGKLFYIDLLGSIEFHPKFGSLGVEVSVKSMECPGAVPGRAFADFSCAEEAREKGKSMVAQAVLGAIEGHATAVRTKDLMLEPTILNHIDEMEFDHWLLQSRVAAEATAWTVFLNACNRAESDEKKNITTTKWKVPFSMLYERKIHPEGSPRRLRSFLDDAVDSIREGTPAGFERSRVEVERGIKLEMEELDGSLEEVPVALVGVGPIPPSRLFIWPILTLAAFLDRVPQADPRSYDKAKTLVRSIIQDELGSSRWHVNRLQDEVRFAEGILGSQKHPCVAALGGILEELSDESPEQFVAMAWPERHALQATVASEKTENTPIPERCWAMRNVAYSFARTNAEGQAKKLLEEAIQLKQDWLGDALHPSLLLEYQQLAEVLFMNKEWFNELGDTCRTILQIVEKEAHKLETEGKLADATILRRGCLQEYGMTMGKEDADVEQMIEKVMKAMEEIGPESSSYVEEACQRLDVVKGLGEKYAEEQEITSRKTKSRRSL